MKGCDGEKFSRRSSIMARSRAALLSGLKEIPEVYSYILSLGGASMFLKHTGPYTLKEQCLRVLHPTLFVYPIFIHLTIFLLRGILTDNYFVTLTSMAASVHIAILLYRVFKFYFDMKRLKSIIWDPTDFHCNLHRPQHALSLLASAQKKIRKYAFYSVIFCLCNSAFWIIFPIFPKVISFLFYGKSYREAFESFPTILNLPRGLPFKEARYLFEVHCSSLYSIIWSISSLIFFAIVHLIKVQYDILNGSLKEFVSSHVEDKRHAMDIKYFMRDQAKLRRISLLLRNWMSPLIASTLILTVNLAGYNLYAIATNPVDRRATFQQKFEYYIKFILYCSITSIETFLYCRFSTIITESNSSVSNTIYNLSWYEDSKKSLKKEILLPILISNRQIQMTAAFMVDISFSTFIEVIRIAYSFYTLITKSPQAKGLQ